MTAIIKPRTLTVSFNDDGDGVRAVKGDMWQFTDDAGNAITPKHYGTKNTFTAKELAAALPNTDLLAQISTLTTDKEVLTAERDSLTTAQSTLTAERDALLTEKGTLSTSVAALTSERDALVVERDALVSQAALVEPLKAQLIAVLGIPEFDAADVLTQMTDAEKSAVTVAVAGNEELRLLWTKFLGRIKGAKIPLNSTTFQAALTGLQGILGSERVVQMFANIKIDIVHGKYIVA